MAATLKVRRTAVRAARNVALLTTAFVSLGSGLAAHASTIADWTFETTAPVTAGPFSPEVGAGEATGSHAGAAVYSSPAGNGSPHSFSSNTWVAGDYYQFQVNTTGFQNISFTWDQTSSNTGPRDFSLSYSTDGTTFTPLVSSFAVLADAAPNPVWSSGTPQVGFTTSEDLSAIAAVDNVGAVYFRITDLDATSANGGAVGTAGTDRIDNVVVGGIPTPEPSSIVLAGLGIAGLMMAAIRRRRPLAK